MVVYSGLNLCNFVYRTHVPTECSTVEHVIKYYTVTRYLRKYKNQFYKIPVSVRSIQYLLCTYLYIAIYNITIVISI